MGELVFYFLLLVAIIVGAVWYFRDPKPVKGPMYPRYINVKYPMLTEDEMFGNKSPLCPICRFHFNVHSRPSQGQRDDIFCAECHKKLRGYGDAFHPSYITNERDWMYLKDNKSPIFWIINSDYEHGDIDATKAGSLIHSLVPEDFAKIKPIQYRCDHNYTYSSGFSWHDALSDTKCSVCHKKTEDCDCYVKYLDDLEQDKLPKIIKPYLERLRELNPRFVISYYYRQDGRVRAKTEPRSGFRVEDYFTLDDWQTVQYILKFSQRKEYTKQTIENALNQYLQMVMTDLNLLINFHEVRERGDRPKIPYLPSTNPNDIREIIVQKREKTMHEKLSEEYLG